ncbi:histidine kinase [Streptomyces sp. 549]|uniref:sensor histidine kinase n=1 Tax=Streptomyces sp. 549 TaxID=3049076 RepID=UPI0024C28ED5|nr:histidine kinase [Streptomyces sp. 549]MDK1472688.1 histidine kinase [Streptomyces sp. 549]
MEPVRFSRRAEDAVLLAPAALELLTILSFASALELGWHAATVAVLLLRRRWPLLVLVAVLPVAFGGYLLLAPMVALYQVARDVPGPRLVAGGAVALFAAGLMPWWPAAGEPWSYEDGLFGVLSAAMLSAGPVALGRLVRVRAELSARLAELARAQRREQRLLAERAVTEERARLAREMHDVVSHQVSLIAVQAGALQVTTGEPESRERAGTIRELGVATLEELRHLVGVLRTARECPGLAEVPALVAASGLDVRLDRSAAGPCWPEAVEQAAYRTVQEALTNIRKYAADASVEVSLGRLGDALTVVVRNAPPGSPATTPAPGPGLPVGGGHGLRGLRERAELLGGRFEAGPTPEGGFLVRAVLPPPAGAHRAEPDDDAGPDGDADPVAAVPG